MATKKKVTKKTSSGAGKKVRAKRPPRAIWITFDKTKGEIVGVERTKDGVFTKYGLEEQDVIAGPYMLAERVTNR